MGIRGTSLAPNIINLDINILSASSPSRFIPGESVPSTHWS
jgi:hypothetical protein